MSAILLNSNLVHGNWSNWSEWSECNKPCDNGTSSRRRSCDNPVPQFGGNKCYGESNETTKCNTHKCKS